MVAKTKEYEVTIRINGVNQTAYITSTGAGFVPAFFLRSSIYGQAKRTLGVTSSDEVKNISIRERR